MSRTVTYLYREDYKIIIIREKSNEQEARRLGCSLDLVTNHYHGHNAWITVSLYVHKVQRIIFNVSYKHANLQFINDSPQA